MIRLGVNVDHVATLRQVRGGTTAYPDLLGSVRAAIKGGARQITIHLREDRRHIQLKDLQVLAVHCSVDLNLEMAVTPQMVRLARKYKPQWCCFVPEKRAELTTEGGLDVIKNRKSIKLAIEQLQKLGIEISLFIDPTLEQVEAAWDVGADAVEFHTGTWVLSQGQKKNREWKRLKQAAQAAAEKKLGVHAGHGLDYEHARRIRGLPFLREVNIGHSLICYALEDGLTKAVQRMIRCLK
jgi:pyridoxine 5-phosphate synthase